MSRNDIFLDDIIISLFPSFDYRWAVCSCLSSSVIFLTLLFLSLFLFLGNVIDYFSISRLPFSTHYTNLPPMWTIPPEAVHSDLSISLWPDKRDRNSPVSFSHLLSHFSCSFSSLFDSSRDKGNETERGTRQQGRQSGFVDVAVRCSWCLLTLCCRPRHTQHTRGDSFFLFLEKETLLFKHLISHLLFLPFILIISCPHLSCLLFIH